MLALRLLPILTVLVCTQLGLFLCLRQIFLPRPDQRRARLVLAAVLVAAGLVLPVWFASARAGLVPPPWVRWLIAYPVLSWHVFSIPLVLLLGLSLSLARRWPRSGQAPPTTEPLQPVALPTRQPPATSPQPADALVESSRTLPESRRIFLARSATGLLGGAAVLSGIGVATQESAPLLSRRDIVLRGLHPDLEGLTVLQLSDIHAGPLITEERMAAMARAGAALAPDLVVFTGDLLDVSARAAEPFARAFAGLRGRLGTFAVLGNHDYYAGPGAVAEALRAMGTTLLRNQGARVGRGRGSLWVGGVDDPLAWDRQAGSVDPQRALRGAARGEPRLLLAHRPSLFELCADAGAQFVLSGHTHGGQIALSPRFTLARLITPYTMGLYRRGDAQLYVHRGMGVVSGAPLRLGSPPELALFTLRCT